MQTAGGRWGILADARTPSPLFAVDSRLDSFLYGLQRTQPEPQHRDNKGRSPRGRIARERRSEQIVRRWKSVGGNHAAQNDDGRKDWSASLHHISRKSDGRGYTGLPADHARRDRPPRG